MFNFLIKYLHNFRYLKNEESRYINRMRVYNRRNIFYKNIKILSIRNNVRINQKAKISY